MTWKRILILIAAISLGPGPALAAPPTGDAPATIVERDIGGNLEYLDERPEVAATRLLDLDDNARANVDSVLAERASLVDRLIRSETDAVIDVEEARADEDDDRTIEAVESLQASFIEGPRRRPLIDALADALPRDAAAEMREMVRDYWRAVLLDARLTPAPNDEYMDARDAAIAAEQRRLFVAELDARVAALADVAFERYDAFRDELGLSRREAMSIDLLFTTPIETAGDEARAEARRARFVKALSKLERPQRMRLFEALEAPPEDESESPD